MEKQKAIRIFMGHEAAIKSKTRSSSAGLTTFSSSNILTQKPPFGNATIFRVCLFLEFDRLETSHKTMGRDKETQELVFFLVTVSGWIYSTVGSS